jgi:hypothetical protein
MKTPIEITTEYIEEMPEFGNYPSQITTKELYEIFIEYGRDNKIGQD